MPTRILVPLDGSVFAESALPLALSLAERARAVVELVTVHEPIPAFAQDDWEHSAREWSEEYLDEVVRRLGDLDLDIRTHATSGSVAETLERRAGPAGFGADLVVMATHGRGTFSRAWLGSVADHFVRKSPCPVVLARPERDERVDLASRWTCEKILVPLDGSRFSEQVLGRAEEIAGLYDATLVLAQVVAYPLEIASPYLPHTVQMNQQVVDEAKQAATEHVEKVAEELRGRGVETDVKVLVDTQPGHGILRACEESGADLVAMATHGRGGVSRAFLGSAADKVVRGAHRPVLLLRGTESAEKA